MTNDIDFNKIALEYIKSYTDEILSAAIKGGKYTKNQILGTMSSTYKRYLKKTYEINCVAKTFIANDKPYPFYELYVNIPISSGDFTISDPQSHNIFKTSHLITIMSSAGSGKSMLMRHLFLDSIKRAERIPVFIELRKKYTLNSSIIETIRTIFLEFGLNIDQQLIEITARSGQWLIFLDGLDELSQNDASALMEEIVIFSEMYSSNCMILSSRPDTSVASWRRFQNFKICALDIDQAEKIVESIPRFDNDKKRFIPELRESLFEMHNTFVVNPLLLSIYFISYCRNSKVSQKISAFYKNAYEALFELHDLRKEGFQREMYAGLDLQDFERAFSAFCMITYAARSLQFTRPDAEKYAEAARSLIRKHFPYIDYKPRKLILDAEKSVALLSDDNGNLEFSHRSFQEYFASVFINYCDTETQEKILHKLIKDDRALFSDNVLNILYELNPILVEKMYINPNIKNFAESCGLRNRVGVTHHEKFIKMQ